MKVYGQGVVDAAERFFHGMYVSAAGDQYLDGTVPDSIASVPEMYLWGIVIGVMIIIAMSAFFYMYMRRSHVGSLTHTQPKTM